MERKLTAILCADVFGYSRLMGENEEATLRTLSSHRNTIDSLIEQHHGRLVNSAGDSVLAEFASVVNAVQCAVDVQAALKSENTNLPPGRRMEFRIGVNLGDVMVEGEQIYGDGVNVAARLESLAEPGGICISGKVREEIRDKLTLGYTDNGEQTVKNIARPVHAWQVLLNGTAPPRRTPRSYWRSGVLSLTGLAIIVGIIVLTQNLTLRPPHTNASIPPEEKPALPLPSIPSIAVLPFTNLGGDPKQDYFADGISDQLINNLSRLPGLFVIARNSSFAYKDKNVREQEIGKELGVKYLLEGSVHKEADQVRIGVELVDASTGTEEWTASYDRPLKDIFAVQDEIVGKVVTTLGLIFNREETKVPWGNPRPTTNLEAYDDLLRASEYGARFTKDDWLMSRRWIEKAIQLDPEYGGAYTALAGNYSSLALFGWSNNPAVDLNHASELAEKALSLDDTDSGALATLCEIHWLQRRFDQALSEGERAVALDPNSVGAYGALVDALTASNRPADLSEAVRLVEKEMRLDPSRRDFYAYFMASAYVVMGRYQEAIPLLKRHLAAYPNQPWAHAALIVAYMELGREHDAQAEAVELNRISPRFLDHAGVGRDPAVNRRWGNDLREAGLR